MMRSIRYLGQFNKDANVEYELRLIRTGTHSDLFK